MRLVQLFALLLAALPALAFGGCVSGQTGSPDCVGPTECLCDTLYSGGNLLRVHVESFTDGKLTAVVDQEIAAVYRSPALAVGHRIAGSVSLEKPCAPNHATELAAGADMLVFFYYSGDPSNGVFNFAVPWSDTLDFGADHLLASTELDVLATPEACVERFSPGPAPPCNDTTGGGPCSVTHLSPQPDYPSGVLLGLVLAASLWCRRRR